MGCTPSNDKESENKFTFQQNGLYFSQRFISSWREENPLPVCSECSRQTDKKHTENGPMIFRQINNANGDLVFFYVTGAQYNFALNTGSDQYSVHLNIEDSKLSLAVNLQQIKLKLDETIELKLGTQKYWVLLEKLDFIKAKTESLGPSPANYEANILIWLNND